MDSGSEPPNEYGSSSSSSSPPPPPPQVLTRQVLPSLTQFLDASTVLECYYVVRMAPLRTFPVPGIHNNNNMNSDNSNNYNNPILVPKTALAFRGHIDNKKDQNNANANTNTNGNTNGNTADHTTDRFELTLEYGPTRILGASSTHTSFEAVPLVNGWTNPIIVSSSSSSSSNANNNNNNNNDDPNIHDSNNPNNNNNNDNTDGLEYISWENESKVRPILALV
jgi:hypothetical protein